jgi:hypothetical protein
MTYIRPNDAALSPPNVLWHAKYALIASFLLDTDSVFAAAIAPLTVVFGLKGYNLTLDIGFRDIVHFLLMPE